MGFKLREPDSPAHGKMTKNGRKIGIDSAKELGEFESSWDECLQRFVRDIEVQVFKECWVNINLGVCHRNEPCYRGMEAKGAGT